MKRYLTLSLSWISLYSENASSSIFLFLTVVSVTFSLSISSFYLSFIISSIELPFPSSPGMSLRSTDLKLALVLPAVFDFSCRKYVFLAVLSEWHIKFANSFVWFGQSSWTFVTADFLTNVALTRGRSLVCPTALPQNEFNWAVTMDEEMVFPFQLRKRLQLPSLLSTPSSLFLN